MSESNKDDGFELHIDRVLKAPRDKIWRCWTERELLEQWFCPKPWRVEVQKMHVRPGGGQDLTMLGPNGEKFPMSGVYLEVVPNERLVLTNAFREGWIPVDHQHPGFMESGFVELSDAPGGGTNYRAGMRHWKEEDKNQHLDMGFYEGWNICADQLDELALTL